MKTRGTILVVDDERYVLDSIAAVLSRRGYAVRTASSVDQALEPGQLDGTDAVLTDLRMPGRDGLDLVRAVVAPHPNLPVVVLTAHGSVPSAVECMRAGAFDYLLKPADPDELLIVVERALEHGTMRRELAYLRSDAGAAPAHGRLVGQSGAWKRVLDLVASAAPSDTSILLLGESGTGKEEIAKLIHAQSRRAAAPLVRVNCAAIPLELFESEFFGHRRGAFSGAVSDRDGRFRVAHRGTLFMDELGSLAETAQAKILRVLQDGVFERVGDSRSTAVDVRLIAATNADLKAEVEAGRFRRDLYYRVAVMTIELPPLRDRRDDLDDLAASFLAEFSRRDGKAIDRIHPLAMADLRAHSWPGNIRELRNVIERGVLLERSDVLTAESVAVGARATASAEPLTLRAGLAAEEKRLLERALEATGGVRREAARRLGIDERNFAYFLKKHGLMARGGER